MSKKEKTRKGMVAKEEIKKKKPLKTLNAMVSWCQKEWKPQKKESRETKGI